MSVKQETPKKNSMLGGWVKNPLERLHKSSDIDKYVAPDSIEFIYGCDTISEGLYADPSFANLTSSSFGHSNKSALKKSDSGILIPFIDHFKRDHFSSTNNLSAPSSKDTSPDVSPQHSPIIKRKLVNGEKRKWFQSSLLNADQKDYSFIDGSNSKSTFKKFSVSNFDLNVVGPTSW